MLVSDICIVGAGPAGSALAARMAALGHRVCLVERSMFPRAHLGESLTPGVLPLLDVLGAREAVEAAGFPRVDVVRVQWGQGLQWRRDPRREGLLVDRGRFDALLLDHATKLGVHVLQPAVPCERRWDGDRWHLRIRTNGGTVELKTKFLADACGRIAFLPRRRRCTGCRTLALYAYWRGRRIPDEPRIEAGADAWYWGVPLPDGSYNTLVFVDFDHFRSGPRMSVDARFHDLIAQSGLMAGCHDAQAGPVLVSDATPYVDENCVTSCSIKVGDAALAIDPLSSSGVQKALQNALAGAVVVNTLLRKPDSSAAAFRFFRESVNTASESHCRWAAWNYQKVAQRDGGSFWQKRAAGAVGSAPPAQSPTSLPGQHNPQAIFDLSIGARVIGAQAIVNLSPVHRSPQLEFVELPCIEGEFVTVKAALRHPNLDGPVAFLGGWEMAPLLKELDPGLTVVQVARSWSNRIPLQSGLALVSWLISRGILVHEAFPSQDKARISELPII
jgi:flavin-dependent dehydrogenase